MIAAALRQLLITGGDSIQSARQETSHMKNKVTLLLANI